MALEGQQGVIAQHAASIIGNAYEPTAAVFDINTNIPGPGIERILEQLF